MVRDGSIVARGTRALPCVPIHGNRTQAEARQEVKYAYCDHSKAKKLLGFKDNTNLLKTIKEMFEWAMKQEDREVKQMPYEIEKGMYSYWK